ncbi:MAG: SpoIIE family protein phosphatase [Bacteroidota bacterium]|nr:SpoIIE family protein phosphatase [Bacteroidota bacterium]
MTDSDFHIEIKSQQTNHTGERICGDVFLTERINEEDRTIIVLSDGMGHGVKANMLATLTATMALNFTREHKEVEKIAEIIMNTLPVCSDRKISYSTFTIIDIMHNDEVQILEYDNPATIILRGNRIFYPEWKCVILKSEKNSGKEILSCSFKPEKEDRIVIFSDGITQSGMGSAKFPFGWGREKVVSEVELLINRDPAISADAIASRLVNLAVQNDGYQPKDDTSCVSVYFREPRKLLICSGPPYDQAKDIDLAGQVKSFKGNKVICGATTADILSRELDFPIEDSLEFHDKELPPISYMESIDLVTEGILTLGKVSRILEKYTDQTRLGKGPADEIIRLIMQTDEVHFIIGTRINVAHQDPSLPVELEIRRTVIKRIAGILEKKFLKELHIQYI